MSGLDKVNINQSLVIVELQFILELYQNQNQFS